MPRIRNLFLGLLFSLAFGTSAQAELTVRYLVSSGQVEPQELAEALGYYDGTGVKLQRVGYEQGGPAGLMALAGNSIDVVSAANAAVLNSIVGGNDFIVLYPDNGIDKDVKSTFYVLQGSPIKKIEDIVGKTIAVNTLGAHLDYAIREALHQKGLPQNAAKLVVVPGPQLEQVLRSHQVDIAAFGFWQSTFGGVARKNGGLRAVFTDNDIFGDFSAGLVVAHRDWVQSHPQEIKAYVDGTVRAMNYAREHPEETRKLFAKLLEKRGENPDIAQYFAGYGVRPSGRATTQDLQFWIDVLVREHKVEKGKLDAAKLLYTDSGAANK